MPLKKVYIYIYIYILLLFKTNYLKRKEFSVDMASEQMLIAGRCQLETIIFIIHSDIVFKCRYVHRVRKSLSKIKKIIKIFVLFTHYCLCPLMVKLFFTTNEFTITHDIIYFMLNYFRTADQNQYLLRIMLNLIINY
jgi:hypothetical protein